jgi:hypothetical protein
LVASSLLVSSTAAIVHTHEDAGHAHRHDSAHQAEKSHAHAGCWHHHHHHGEKNSTDHSTSHEYPAWPHSHDDCSLCHFLLEHPLPPSYVEVLLAEVILPLPVLAPRVHAVAAAVNLPLARGPPCVA